MSLTKHPCGSLKELSTLALPCCLTLASNYLMGFCDRLILARYSLEALEACVNAAFLCQLFQLCFMSLASLVQVYVSQSIGKKKPEDSGKYVWQMIWFTLAIFFVTLPLCPITEWIYFYGTPTESLGKIYFRCLIFFNCFFPIGVALGSFYHGKGGGKIVFLASLVANLTNLIMDPLFIFGMSTWIPAMGILGAALATGMSQVIFCLVLFCFFLRKKERILYGTGHLRLNVPLFWKIFKVSSPRILSQFMHITSWLVSAYIMNLKGGDHLLALTIGNSLNLCFFFINEGMGKAVMSVASYAIGKQDWRNILLLFRSSFLFLFLTSIFFFFPFVVFPKKLLTCLFKYSFLEYQFILLEKVCFWLWIWFILNGIRYIAIALILASEDTLFAFIVNSTTVWIFTTLPIYLFIYQFNYPPYVFYFIIACGGLFASVVCLIRFLYRYRIHILFPSRT